MSTPANSGGNGKLPPTRNNIPPNQIPCRFWMQGDCKFQATNRCKYLHDEKHKGIHRKNQGAGGDQGVSAPVAPRSIHANETSNPVQASSSQSTAPEPASKDVPKMPSKQANGTFKSQKVCRDFKAGNCPRGDKCRFSHALQIANPDAEIQRKKEQEKLDRERIEREETLRREALEALLQAQRAVAVETLRQETLQRQQAQRIEEARRRREAKEVLKAANKRRQEELAALGERQAALRAEEEQRKRDAQEAAKKRHQEELAARREQEAVAVEKFIASGSSLIECGAGLEIRHVITGFDLCRVTIKNLPRDASREEIADIFRHQGVDSSKFFILQVKPNGNKLEAIVIANADQGQAIAVGLESIPFRNEILSFEISDNANWNTIGLSTSNSPFLTISWWLPSETIVVKYLTIEEAQRQCRSLNSKVWKGRRLRVVMNDRPNGAAALRHYRVESIKLMGCPQGSGYDQEFYNFVGSFDVKIVQSSAYDQQDALRAVREHLSNCPGVQMDSFEAINNDERNGEVRVKVQFEDWDKAKLAHEFMDKKRLGLNHIPILRSWLPKPLQYTITIPRQQFEAQKKQWDSLSEKRQGSDVYVHTRIGDRGDVFVRVLGQDKKAAGPLKVRVESMIAGEKLNSTTQWHPSFSSPRGKAFFDRIYTNTKVYVRNDFKTRSLRIYGEANVTEQARKMIQEEVDRLAQMETTRDLDPPVVRFFMREGLGRLKELLGEENVTLNVAMIPAKITIKGGGEANHHLQRLISESRTVDFSDGLLPGGDNEICPICTDDVSHPEQLGCGHTYCSACLKHFLTSATEYPLVCMGDENTCKVPVALPFISRFLPKEVFQQHIEAAFASYLEKHPQELKYCTTPDCTQIYRRSNEKTMLQCPSCFSSICPACDEEAHEGMTCEERRIHKNPAEQERLNNELADANGWKKCPQCTALIEKTMGCNHIECRCGAHICWRCLGIFNKDTIYPHMRETHGGIHDVIPAGFDMGQDNPADFLVEQANELARIERQRQLAQEVQQRRVAALQTGRGENANLYVAGARQLAAGGVRGWGAAIAQGAQEAQARRLAEGREVNERFREEQLRRLRERQTIERARLLAEVEQANERTQQEATRRAQEQAIAVAMAERRRREEREAGWGCVVM